MNNLAVLLQSQGKAIERLLQQFGKNIHSESNNGQEGDWEDENSGSNLELLKDSPEFQQLRQVIQQQPQMLQPILEELRVRNPQLANLISQHLDIFLQLLSEDSDAPAPPAGANPLSVTEDERAAIERV